mgnify:FL=1
MAMAMDEATPESSPTPTGPRVKRREVWVDLSSEYEQFRFRLWVNPPSRISRRLALRAIDACTAMFLEHNGWCDGDGNLMPQPTDPAFWLVAPNELIGLMIVLAEQEMQKLPNLIARQRPR